MVNYGLMTDDRGCPVSVSVFEGNAGDPKTLLPQVEKARDSFGLERLVMVGDGAPYWKMSAVRGGTDARFRNAHFPMGTPDRCMISTVPIDAIAKLDGVDWITALKRGAITKLADAGHLQLDLFDERNLIRVAASDSGWFAPSAAGFMINYRVDDMDGMIAQLARGDIALTQGPESHENGRFAWIIDPDGNKVELWEQKVWDEGNTAR